MREKQFLLWFLAHEFHFAISHSLLFQFFQLFQSSKFPYSFNTYKSLSYFTSLIFFNYIHYIDSLLAGIIFKLQASFHPRS